MPEPFASATTLLTNVSNAIRQVYHKDFPEMHRRFGGKTNRMFKPSKLRVDGDGVNVQVEDHLSYPARFGKDLNGDFHTPRTFGAQTYKVTLSEVEASNDFSRLAASAQVTWTDIKRVMNKKASAVDFADKTVKELLGHVGETTAVHRHLDKTARVCLLNGTPAQNDNRIFANCSATPAASTYGARVPIDNGSIATLPRGMFVDSYTGTTKDYSLWVSDYNPRDKSVGFYGLDGNGDPDNTVDISNIANNDAIYISGEKDKGLISLGEWFKDPGDIGDGDSHFSKDRAVPDNRWMLPHTSGPTSLTPFQPEHIDDLCIELGYIEEDPEGGYIALTTPELEQAYRDAVGEDIFIPFPSKDEKGKLFATYGFDGNMYRHPTMGRIMLQADSIATPNKIRFLRPGDWETLYAPGSEFEFLPGEYGNWYRMESGTAGAGRTTVFRMDGLACFVDICTLPRYQAEIVNMSP